MTRPGASPRHAMDYPTIADGLWIIWASNGKPWPDANRRLSYLGKRRDVMRDYALFCDRDGDAETFPTEAEARAFLAKHNAKRPAPYHGVNVSTVADMKAACGFA